jgi:hypothetical protein
MNICSDGLASAFNGFGGNLLLGMIGAQNYQGEF